MHRINLTLVYFFIFTVVSSTLAYYIVVKAHESFERTPETAYYYTEEE